MNSDGIVLTLPDAVDVSAIVGPDDRLLRIIEKRTEGTVVLRGDRISISGSRDEVEFLVRVFSHLIDEAKSHRTVSADDLGRMIDSLRSPVPATSSYRDDVLHSYHGRVIRPKTAGQKAYVDAIRSHTVTFGLGPAGTGKTYLAMAMAVGALKRHEIGRIVLTRPVVEAGENLGFLPGTLEDKVDPYVRPLFDALFEMMDVERASELVDRGIIEIAPLAYMRGRTLNDAFVVLDEAQNTTPEQMKMFLTRLGFNSKFVITGDASQRDLIGRKGGLSDIEDILADVRDVSFIHLTRTDVVRHALVGRIVEAYDAYENANVKRHSDSRKGRHGSSH